MKLAEMNVTEFARVLASDAPAPGGGSTAALAGALGAALTAMVCELTVGKKQFAALYDAAYGVESRYLESLSGDVSWFCKKFDYRYDQEPWYNSKDSVQRAIKFLSGTPRDEK